MYLVLGIQSTTNLVSSLALQISESCLTSVMSTRIRFPRKQKAVPYIFDFLNDPDITRLDTNQGLHECVDPRTGATIKVQKRIWMVLNVREQFSSFHASVHYASFRRDSNNATVGRKIFRAIVQESGMGEFCQVGPSLVSMS